MTEHRTWAAPLRGAQFRTWLVGQGCSAVGSAVTAALIPLIAVSTLRASASTVGFITASGLAATAIARPVGSLRAERSTTRLRALVVFDLVSLLAILTVPALWLARTLTITSFWSLSIADAVLGGIFGAYAAPVITALVDDHQLPGATGLLGSTGNIAKVAGPAIAAGLLAVVAAPIALALDATSYAVGAATDLRVLHLNRRDQISCRSEPNTAAPPATSAMRALLAPFTLKRTRVLLIALLGVTLVNGAAIAELAVFMVRTLHLAVSFVALVGAAGAVGGIFAGLTTAQLTQTLGTGRTATLGVGGMCVGVLCLPFAPTGTLGLIPCLSYEMLTAAGGTIFISMLFTIVIRELHPDHLARGMASSAAVPEVGQMLGATAAGILAGFISLRTLMDGIGVLGIVVLSITAPTLRRTLWSHKELLTDTCQFSPSSSDHTREEVTMTNPELTTPRDVEAVAAEMQATERAPLRRDTPAKPVVWDITYNT